MFSVKEKALIVSCLAFTIHGIGCGGGGYKNERTYSAPVTAKKNAAAVPVDETIAAASVVGLADRYQIQVTHEPKTKSEYHFSKDGGCQMANEFAAHTPTLLDSTAKLCELRGFKCDKPKKDDKSAPMKRAAEIQVRTAQLVALCAKPKSKGDGGKAANLIIAAIQYRDALKISAPVTKTKVATVAKAKKTK